METQSAFMAAAAAAVLVAAVLLRRRDRAALLLSGLAVAFGAWALGRGALAIDLAWGRGVARGALGLIGPLSLAFVWSLGAAVPAPRRLLPAKTSAPSSVRSGRPGRTPPWTPGRCRGRSAGRGSCR